MAELKGLLDSAKRKLGGLLGDFPQGFNAGAVAGIAGYPGDIAYMLDTAGRAITGQDTQPAAQDFPGTTDYIAAKAGYPIPGSFSGQLGAAVGGMLTPGPGDLGRLAPLGAMFLGAKAKTAMPDVLEYAQAMEKAGKSADEIWQTTGKLGQPWFRGADGKWRFEVDDSARFKSEPAKAALADTASGDVIPLSQLLGQEDEIARAYPDIGNVLFERTDAGGGLYYPPNKFGTEKIEVGSRDARSTALHETMHPIQVREGFALGGLPANSSKSAEDDYWRLAAEAEARNVQHRADMSMDERLTLPPWVTQDVPTKQQIVRFGDGPAMAIPFWHGSPHKYDAVDLSKIGTGEGAQAYGHGYYGADSAQTAIEYRDKLSQDTKYKGTPTQDLPMAGESNEAAAIRSVTGDVALGVDPAEAIAKQADKWRAYANRYREYAKGMPAEKAAIAEQRAQGFEEIAATVERFNPDDFYKNAGNLYRGEYRWPDPAKEAATPLTGEDLLDWDRPLSEQPGLKSYLSQSLGDVGPGNANNGGAFSKGSSAPAHIGSNRDVPLNPVVGNRVGGMLDNGKVGNSVVGLVPVDVVDALAGKQLSAEVGLHNQAMNLALPSVNGGNGVPLGVNSASSPVGGVALPSLAEGSRVSGDVVGVPVNTLSAIRAGDFDKATGHDLYRAISDELGSDKAATNYLTSRSVLGIRYLDQMSRGAGDGTRNYVMFDEKGIKLLERNGSPIEDFAARRAGKAKPYREAMGLPMDEASRMQRAQEMGFDTPAVHWSRHGVDVNELDSGKFAIAPFDAVGTHVGTPEAAMKRFEGWASPERGAGVTYPVVIKSKKPYLDPSGKPWNEQQLTEHLREIGGYDSARASYKELNSKLRDKIFAEYDSIPYINDVEDAGSISYIAPPQNIRSRFAAFDPSKKDSANLLAGLAALGVGTAAVKSQQEKERRNGL